jgi:hypothetical protein
MEESTPTAARLQVGISPRTVGVMFEDELRNLRLSQVHLVCAWQPEVAHRIMALSNGTPYCVRKAVSMMSHNVGSHIAV